jgi:hypothetical protein
VIARTVLVAGILVGAPALAPAQSASAPLSVTATVISSCKVNVPRQVPALALATMPVAVGCARGGAAPRVQRPVALPHSEVRKAVLIINF